MTKDKTAVQVLVDTQTGTMNIPEPLDADKLTVAISEDRRLAEGEDNKKFTK